MNLSDIFNAQTIALNYTNAGSNLTPYLGLGFFPAQKRAGLDLAWLKGHNGLPISLKASNFDTKTTYRDRIGVSKIETEMPFFKEGFLISEKDRQEILRVQDSNDPYAQTVIERVFDDTRNLIDGADVVPERMRMQLLAPIDGNFGITLSSNGVQYTYNYDPDSSLRTNHYLKIQTAADKWNAPSTCDPMKDIETALDAQEAAAGNRPEILLMSKTTFNLMKNSEKVRSGILAQNITANVNYTSRKIKEFVEEELGVQIIVYNKQYRNENGVAQKFYADNIIAMLPSGAIGSTWYGTTPEEADLQDNTSADVAIVNTGIAITTSRTSDPVNVQIKASEIVLPSWENADNCYFLQVV